MGAYVSVDSANFAAEVLQSATPVLVDFYATWCGPCKMLAPVVEQIAEERAGSLKVCKLDIDAANDIAMQYRIMSVPTLLLFKDGQVVEQLVGAQPKERLLAAIDAKLA